MEDTQEVTSLTEVNGDDWHNVKDAKKRKQIQDKLAQRARRQRLGDAKRTDRPTPRQPLSRSEEEGQASTRSRSATENMLQLCFPQNDDLVPVTDPVIARHSIIYDHTPNLSFDIPFQLSLAGALYINGQILGLACCITIPARSIPASPDVPQPLRPTALQLLTIHATCIDRFPFPKMRDNYINMSSIVDEEELTRDVLVMPSLSIIPGCLPWDPRAWKMEKPFAEKWGFLFHGCDTQPL